MCKRFAIIFILMGSALQMSNALSATEKDGKHILEDTIDVPFLYYAVSKDPVDYKSVFEHGVSFNHEMKQEYLRTKDVFKKKELFDKFSKILEKEFQDLSEQKLAYWVYVHIKPYDFETSSFEYKLPSKKNSIKQGIYKASWKYPKRIFNLTVKSIDEAKEIDRKASARGANILPALIVMKAKETRIKGSRKEIILEPITLEVYQRGTQHDVSFEDRWFKLADKLVAKFDL